ncbi:MAG: hypothetical protein AAFV53_24105 [Myxococcota bacterium]
MYRLIFSLIAMMASSSTTLAATDILVLGSQQGQTAPLSLTAAEFNATGFTDAFVYDVGELPVTEANPEIPGLLSIDEDQCNSRGCARVLNVRFTIPAAYANQKIVMTYSRSGSELNTIRVDGVTHANVAGEENRHQRHRISLGKLDEGEHTLSIQYTDSGAANTHYIDYIRLIVL